MSAGDERHDHLDRGGRSGDRHEIIMAEAERIIALGEASETAAPYPVNQPTIGTWLDAMGYDTWSDEFSPVTSDDPVIPASPSRTHAA